MRTSPAYAITRRRGKLGTVKRLTGTTTDDDNLTRADVTTDTIVRFMYKSNTQYSRLLRATAAQQRVGDVSFIICLKDVTFTALQSEDKIEYQGQTFQVITSDILDDGLVITARLYGWSEPVSVSVLSLAYTGPTPHSAISTPTTFTFVGELVITSDASTVTFKVEKTTGSTDVVFDLGVTSGLTFITGDGTADVELEFSGSVADVNAAIDSLSMTVQVGSPGGSSAILATVSTVGLPDDTATWNVGLIE